MSRGLILVVDDEADLRRLVRKLLEGAGYEVVTAEDGRAALRAMYATPPDLVVLDVHMPELDGWQTLERIRHFSSVPVLMLTARSGEREKVRGLSGGADDYVTKPFGRSELLARVGALMRRPRESAPALGYSDAAVEVDFAQARVVVEGREVQLTPQEFRLLTTFVQHPNQVLSRDQLVQLAWGGTESAAPDQAKVYVSYLRRKLRRPELIETVRGFGYRYRRPS